MRYGRLALGAASCGGVRCRDERHHLDTMRDTSTRACSTSTVLFSVLFNIYILSLPCHSQLTRAHAHTVTDRSAETHSRQSLCLSHTHKAPMIVRQPPHGPKSNHKRPNLESGAGGDRRSPTDALDGHHGARDVHRGGHQQAHQSPLAATTVAAQRR
jgi:hypothetical protein